MKLYVAVTGLLFGLLTLAHVWRVYEEPHLIRDPFFAIVTVLSAGICVWSWRVARRGPG